MEKWAFLILFGLILSSCAHHRDVRPGAEGIHRVVIQTDDADKGARDAISQADHFCKERNLSAAFLDEKKTYTGDVDESTYKKGKMVGRVAKTVGGTAWALGGDRESNAGGVVGLGGVAVSRALGDGYTVEMRFKCQ